MLGIRRPDSHALLRIPPTKRADRDACSLPRAGSFFGAIEPLGVGSLSAYCCPKPAIGRIADLTEHQN